MTVKAGAMALIVFAAPAGAAFARRRPIPPRAAPN
jgi:hypothetical protein